MDTFDFNQGELLKRLDDVDLSRLEEEMPKIAVLGITNSGKSSFINHLFGSEVTPVSVRSNTTKEVGEYIWGKDKAVMDFPGHSAQQDTQELIEYAKQSDLVLYFINATQGLMDEDIRIVEELRNLQVPLIFALSRIDMLGDSMGGIQSQVDELLEDIRERLPLYSQDVIVPFSTKKGWNVDLLIKNMLKVLPIAKQLGFARRLRDFGYKDKIANSLVMKYSVVGGAVGLIPIPISDILILTPLQIRMVSRIAQIYGYKLDKRRIKEFIATAGAGVVFRTAARQLVKLIPGVGSVIAGGIAFSGTYGIGVVAREYFKSGMSKTADELITLYKEAMTKGKILYKENKDLLEKEKERIEKNLPREDEEALEEYLENYEFEEIEDDENDGGAVGARVKK